MTTMLSLILAFMLSIGGSPAASVNPAGCPGDTGIQAPIDNNRTINRFFEDYREKTASRPISKKIIEIPLINQPKTQIRIRFSLFLKDKLRLMGYIDSMNLYQAFGMNPVNFTDPFGTKIKTEDLYELKRISESKGPDAAKRWIDRNPNFTSGEKLDLHMKVIFGFKDPDEFSVLNDWISSTTYDIGKPFGLEGYLKFHAGVKYNQPGLQAEGLAEIGEKGVTFGVVGHYVGVGIQKLAEKFPWFRKTLDFLTKPVSKLFKRGGGSTATSGVKLGKLTAEGNTYWRSSSGLRYGPDPRFGNRIQHVLRHSVDDTSRAGLHGVFDAGKKGTLNVIDEAWNIAKQGGPGVSVVTQGSRTVYTIDIGRRIGYVGGQVGASLGNPAAHHIQLVIKGVDDVITAFPIIPGLL
jgi:hypothetical protein